MKTLGKVILVATVGVAASAHAATDGNLGATSVGTSDVTLIKDEAVQITNVANLDLGTFNTVAADISASDDVCVFNSTATYNVTVDSVNGAFQLNDGGANDISYAVTWEDSTGVVIPVVYNTTIPGMVGDRTSTTCNGTDNATFAVSVSAVDFNTAAPGTYTDTLTLTIAPL